jgi:hypothetical protein
VKLHTAQLSWFPVITLLLYCFCVVVWREKETQSRRVKYWEIIADNLSKAGWSWGWVLTGGELTLSST